MDNKTIFIKTAKGEDEVKVKDGSLSGDFKRALLLVDGKSTYEELEKRAVPSLRVLLPGILRQLQLGAYIRDKSKPFSEPQIVAPKIVAPKFDAELDFTGLASQSAPLIPVSKSSAEADRSRNELEAALEAAKMKARTEAEARAEANAKLAAEVAARSKAEADMRAKQDTLLREQAEAKAQQEAAARLQAERIAMQARLQQEAFAKAQAVAEARLKQETEALRLQAEQEAARVKAELAVATQAKAAAEAARLQAEQESARIKTELEAAKAFAEAKALAEERARQEIEVARLQAAQEAEAARLQAEQEAARVKAAAEAAQTRAAEEARALAEEHAKREAEAARVKAEQAAQIARLKAEQEAMRAKVEADAKALAEERARQEIEAARLKATQEVEAARLQAEQEAARVKAAAEAAQIRAAKEARALAEEHAKREAEAARVKAEQDAQIARLKTEQEAARAKAEADAKALTEARARQEAETAQIKAQLEAAQAKAEAVAASAALEPAAEEITEEERLKVEQLQFERAKFEFEKAAQEAAAKASREEQKLAAEQAKAWADAERRAKELAKIQEATAPQPVDNATVAPAKSSKVRRKPVPFGKIAAGLLVFMLLSVLILPYVMPLHNYIAPLEQRLSVQFKQPVHVGSLRAATLPPKLQLEKVTLGNGQEVTVGNAVLEFDLFSIFSPVKIVRNVELQDVSLNAAMLDKELMWMQGIGVDASFPVAHVTVQHARIVNEETPLPVFNGEIEIGEHGKVSKAMFKSEDAKFDVTLLPMQSSWQISLNVKDASFPVFQNVFFNELSARGEVTADEANFVNVDGQAYGGFLNGKARLNWQKGWRLQAHIEARSVELGRLFAKGNVAGELAVTGDFSASGVKLGKLEGSQQISGSFAVKKGVINGIDMVETARLGSRQNITGGRTHLDELTGVFQIDNRARLFQQLEMTSGILSGSGTFEVSPSEQLSGRFAVELQSRGGSPSLVLSGSLTEPVLRAAR